MDKKNIKKELSKIVTEIAVSGEMITKRAQKVSKEENDAYLRDVTKKMKDYDKNLKAEGNDAIEEPKHNYEGSEKEYHDEMEIRNGQEMINYDREPSKRFKERAEMAIKGDSKMGNKTYTGKENGNTESMWGASDDKFGEKLVATAKASAKKRNDATPTLNQFGDDIESAKGTAKGVNRKIAVEGMKRIKFKKSFNGVQNAISLIPEAFKVEGKKFELTDGNEKYLVEWKGGNADILKASDSNMLSEQFDKIKHLMSYKSEDTLGTLTASERVNENTRIMENPTAVGFGTQGNGFTSEGDLMEDEVVVEEEVVEEDVNAFGLGGSDEDHLKGEEDKEEEKEDKNK